MKRKIRISWNCVSHHTHRWQWTAWLCCKVSQLKHLLRRRGGL